MTKILVIEDDSTVQTLIHKLLTAEGFDVVSASDGVEGLQLAQDQAIDLIISDIMMPGFDGFELLEQLHNCPDTARIPFIFLSAKSERVDMRQGMELGADDYLTKPFTRAELLGAIAARLDKQTNITKPYLDEMKRAADSLGQLAYRDPLTSLPNRILLHQRLKEVLNQAKRSQQSFAVFCLSLDRFKGINDSLGYAAGDQILQGIAGRLNEALGEQAIVARLGGDEFSLVISQNLDKAMAMDIAGQVQKILGEPYQVNHQYVSVQVSIGIALYAEHGSSPDELLHRADIAMRAAKRSMTAKSQIYDWQMSAQAEERRLLEEKLVGALERGEFQLLYQPQVNLITGRIMGVEALLRWLHPELGLMPTSRFIPVMEETGWITSIGEWVLRMACHQAHEWQKIVHVPVRVSVNLSVRQFKQTDLVQTVDRILRETQLSPGTLSLEVTETSVMEDVETAVQVMQELKSMGVHLAIDDFGTGYSSLNYLKQLPLDTLKIDQTFVRDVTTNSNDAAIVKAIIAMAHSMQLKVIAEGVETEEQLTFLRQSGCYSMQGYLFSPAVSADEFGQMLKEDQRLGV